jgi:hypothetical protein
MNLIFLEPDELELWKPTEQKTFKLSLVWIVLYILFFMPRQIVLSCVYFSMVREL